MRFAALATDYDGTLAHGGVVAEETIAALRRLRHSGRRVILVTGRTLADLQHIFPDTKEFDSIVAENGATLYDPASGTEEVLAESPAPGFIERLRHKGVVPLEWGKVIVATDESRRQKVLDAISELGLELQIIFNKGSLMILPSGVNKATGLQTAAERLNLSLHNIAGVGDAENDHAFLAACEFPAAVANALPALKERVELVTRQPYGAGVVELVEQIVENDLSSYLARLGQPVSVGTDDQNRSITLRPCAMNLIVGSSGGGKSSVTTAFLEALAAANYQFCILDPEGDYENVSGAVVVGSPFEAPASDEIIKLLEQPAHNAIANLLAVDLDQRPNWIRDLVREMNGLRKRVGRPHCFLLDEAHHFLASSRDEVNRINEWPLDGTTFITVHPDRLPAAILRRVQTLLIAGKDTGDTIRRFCSTIGIPTPAIEASSAEARQMLAWEVGTPNAVVLTPAATETVRIRHRRKYAEGELPADRSFYFKGPENKLNLRAYNLMTFLNLMQGVDDQTWLFHLRNREYSKWFRDAIKDEEMAREAESIERDGASLAESRKKMQRLISGRYTLPA